MTDISKRLGFGGSAEVNGVQVLILSGSFDFATAISYLNMIDIPPSDVSRSRTKHADGTTNYSGSLNFDVSSSAMALFTTSALLARHFQFTVGIHDGVNQFEMTDCMLTSLTIAGAPGGVLNSSISFIATSGRQVGTVSNDYILVSDPPLGYWWSGGTDVRDWTFTMNQDAQPVYINQNTDDPQYLKAGLIDYSLQVTLYSDLAPSSINIQTKNFSLTGNTVGEGYTFNGVTDLGMFSHTFETAADITTGSDDTIITIT